MKRICKIFMILSISFSVIFSSAVNVLAIAPSDIPIVVYGETLSDEQKEEVRRLLEITDEMEAREYIVTGEDIAKYIDGDPNSNMYSSAKIIVEPEGKGINIQIVTPEYITQVTEDMYRNALLTAGVEDATVEVASPIPVTGGSALSGIYKAYDAEGAELDKDRMEVANEELDLATELSEKEGLDADKVSELLAEIKKEIADKKPESKEDIEKIVDEILIKLEISLSEKDRELLLNLFDKMREIDIDFDRVKGQLEDIASKIKDKVGDLDIEIDEGVWDKFVQFIKNIIESIMNLFQGDSSSD